MKTYLAVYLGSLLTAIILTPLIIRFATALKLYDRVNIRKVHDKAIVRIGGVAIFLSTMILVFAVLCLDNAVAGAFFRTKIQIAALLLAGTAVFLVGLVDDIRSVRARYKLIAQLVAASAMCLAGVRINSVTIPGLFSIEFGILAWPITIFWIVGITNAVNLIDGLDGLAAGIAAITCAVIAALAISIAQPIIAVIALALLGSLCGFLVFNFNPAKLFMGDCGSMFIGFILASASVICATESHTFVALALPLLALGLPVFDMAFVILRRYLSRRRITSADRGHLHHLLLDMGLRHRHVVICMYALTTCAAGLGMFMIVARGLAVVIIFTGVAVLLVIVFSLLGAINYQNTIFALKRNHRIAGEKKREIESFEKVELHFRYADNFETWWQAVCFAADSLDCAKATLPLINRDGTKRVMNWTKADRCQDRNEDMKTTISVRDRRSDSTLKLSLNVCPSGSIESAGRRIALFGRLMEEYSVADL